MISFGQWQIERSPARFIVMHNGRLSVRCETLDEAVSWIFERMTPKELKAALTDLLETDLPE